MKKIENALRDFLLGTEIAYIADLFCIELTTGSKIYFCSGDKDIVYNSVKYDHSMFLMKKNGTKTEGKPTIDSYTLTIYDDQDHEAMINGRKIHKSAYDGTLDNAILSAYKAYCDPDTLDVVGALEMFTGRVTQTTTSGLSTQLTVKSEGSGLNASFPPRIFAAQNSYSTNASGVVVTSSTDKHTMVVPMKPNSRVLVRAAK